MIIFINQQDKSNPSVVLGKFNMYQDSAQHWLQKTKRYFVLFGYNNVKENKFTESNPHIKVHSDGGQFILEYCN